MKVKAAFVNPGKFELELTIQADLDGWKRIASELSGNYPSWKLASRIREAVRKAETQVQADEGE